MYDHLWGYEETTVLRLPKKSRPLTISLLSKSKCDNPQQKIWILKFEFHFLLMINIFEVNIGFFIWSKPYSREYTSLIICV